MHAVLVSVTINDGEAATKYLRGEIVPRVEQAPGFVAGYWVRVENGDQGRGPSSLSLRTPLALPQSTSKTRWRSHTRRGRRGRGRRERLSHASRRRTSRVVVWTRAEGHGLDRRLDHPAREPNDPYGA